MSKYIQNKNFIPKQFYNKVEQKRVKEENKILTLFLAFNIFLIPISMNTINKMKESKRDIQSEEVYSKYNSVDLETVKMWIENITTDDIAEAYIANNRGEIKINTLDNVKKLDLSNRIKISNLEFDNDGIYSLGVILNE